MTKPMCLTFHMNIYIYIYLHSDILFCVCAQMINHFSRESEKLTLQPVSHIAKMKALPTFCIGSNQPIGFDGQQEGCLSIVQLELGRDTFTCALVCT